MTEPIGDPFIALMERTLANLELFDTLRRPNAFLPDGPRELFEVTQTINSFLGMLVMPWDRVLNQAKLNGTSNKALELKKRGFPPLESSQPDTDQSRPSLGAMLDSMRNGAAHGGITILGLRDFQAKCPGRPSPTIAHDHIAAIEIESKSDLGRGPRNWGCVLSVDEMRLFLNALYRLTNDEQFVKPDVWKEHARVRGTGQKQA